MATFGAGGAYLPGSATGFLSFVTRRYVPPDRSLVWIDRRGKTTPVTGDRRAYGLPRISPDGMQLASVAGRGRSRSAAAHRCGDRTGTRRMPRACAERGWIALSVVPAAASCVMPPARAFQDSLKETWRLLPSGPRRLPPYGSTAFEVILDGVSL